MWRIGAWVNGGQNTTEYETPFTVSVDLIGHGCTTGISASDRAKTIKALANPNTRTSELGKPGHIFPLKARKGGVLRRAGHTEAAIDLARLAGLYPAGVIVEIMNEDGSMARMPELQVIAKKHQLKIVTIKDLIAFRIKNESLIEKQIDVDLLTEIEISNYTPFVKSLTTSSFGFSKRKMEKMSLYSSEFTHHVLLAIFLVLAVVIVALN